MGDIYIDIYQRHSCGIKLCLKLSSEVLSASFIKVNIEVIKSINAVFFPSNFVFV